MQALERLRAPARAVGQLHEARVRVRVRDELLAERIRLEVEGAVAQARRPAEDRPGVREDLKQGHGRERGEERGEGARHAAPPRHLAGWAGHDHRVRPDARSAECVSADALLVKDRIAPRGGANVDDARREVHPAAWGPLQLLVQLGADAGHAAEGHVVPRAIARARLARLYAVRIGALDHDVQTSVAGRRGQQIRGLGPAPHRHCVPGGQRPGGARGRGGDLPRRPRPQPRSLRLGALRCHFQQFQAELGAEIQHAPVLLRDSPCALFVEGPVVRAIVRSHAPAHSVLCLQHLHALHVLHPGDGQSGGEAGEPSADDHHLHIYLLLGARETSTLLTH